MEDKLGTSYGGKYQIENIEKNDACELSNFSNVHEEIDVNLVLKIKKNY